MNKLKLTHIGRALVAISLATGATAQIRITEYMYTGFAAEFVELTNVGATPIDVTGWSFDDDHHAAGLFPLDTFGLVQPGESVLITETTATLFAFDWNLPATVRVLGGVTHNLGRNDEINIYDNNQQLVEQLTYGDQTFPGTIRTAGFSGNPHCDGILGTNNIFAWDLSAAGDSWGSYASVSTDVGNPGTFVTSPCGPVITTYCTAGTTSNNCTATISGLGNPSASNASGFTIFVSNVEGQKQGIIFYGVSGRQAVPWGVGGSSYLCVKAPTQRTTTQSTGGTASQCDGALQLDWNAWRAANPGALGNPFASGQVVNAQGWFRDPPAVKTTSLSDGLEFTLAP